MYGAGRILPWYRFTTPEYLELDTDGYAKTEQLGNGTADGTTVLYGDNTWGPVAGGLTPAISVVSEESFGQAANVGSATTYARGDHTHGTPAYPDERYIPLIIALGGI